MHFHVIFLLKSGSFFSVALPDSGSAAQRGRHPEEKERPRGHFSTVLKIQFIYSQKSNCSASVPNFHSHVSVSDLFIPRISKHIFLQQNRKTDTGNI
jgi:hypothetical protein